MDREGAGNDGGVMIGAGPVHYQRAISPGGGAAAGSIHGASAGASRADAVDLADPV